MLDVTAALGVVSVMGPKARTLLSLVTTTDLSNQTFPFGTAQEIRIAGCLVRALRLTYVGELGWELHAAFADIPKIYDALVESGKPLGLTHAGHYAINAMRIEKAYRAWGHELSTDETPLEAGLAFAIDWSTDFLGKEALLDQKETGIHKRLAAFVVEDSQPQLWGSEPIFKEGHIVGHTTSAAFGPTLGSSIALGYVHHEDDVLAFIRDGGFCIRCDGQDFTTKATLRSPYDPKRSKLEV